MRGPPECYDSRMATTGARKDEDKDVIAKLADRGEQTIAKLAELPGGTRALKAFNELRARVDELARKVRGVDELEHRVAKLEKELAALKRAQKATAASKTKPV